MAAGKYGRVMEAGIQVAVHPRLVELAEVLLACRVALLESNGSHWAPAPGSAAADDDAALPSPDPRLPASSGLSGFPLISEATSSYLVTSGAHMGGLAALYGCGEVTLSPAMLVRAVLENCAHAMWIIGSNSAASPENRLARAYLENLLSAEEAKKNAGRMGPKSGDIYRQASADYARVRSDILQVFPGATLSELSKGHLAGQQMLKPEGCVAWMYKFLHAATGSSVDERTGIGVYGFLSNMTHPTLYPVRQLRVWEPADHDGHATSSLALDLPFLERQATAAVVAFYNTLSYIIGYYGWPSSAHDRLTSLIDEILPGTFVAD